MITGLSLLLECLLAYLGESTLPILLAVFSFAICGISHIIYGCLVAFMHR